MLRIDQAILDTNAVICKNIGKFDMSERGLMSQNILSQLRNFVEYIAKKVYAQGADIDPNNYADNEKAIKFLQARGNLRFLAKFHALLQKSVSHYTMNEDGSERLMLKYYEYLLKIQTFLRDNYGMEVLSNINDFPLNTDSELADYYAKIAERIEYPTCYNPLNYNERYYIQKIKPFFVNHRIYYEVTFTAAMGAVSKFDRVIAFTKLEILGNYAVKLSIHNDIVHILDKDMGILVIDGWSVSIRPCEWENLSEIFGERIQISTSSQEYQAVMQFLTTDRVLLNELADSDHIYYDSIKAMLTSDIAQPKIFGILDQCRNIIQRNLPGCNVLRYLLHNMNNRIIKSQLYWEPSKLLSKMYLKSGCKPFDQMPFCTSLVKHNPSIYDLLDSISEVGREHEFFARYINSNANIGGHLFTSKSEIDSFNNIDNLILQYNKLLYSRHTHRRMEEFNGHIYSKEHADNCTMIIRKLQELASSGVDQYTSSVDYWLTANSYVIDDESKKQALRQMFASSHVALIYGSAGTGKSTLINHISNFWAGQRKLYLANTHPAVDNLRRKVNSANCTYDTIAKFLQNNYQDVDCDILFIDECSTVSNSDMRKILDKATFQLLVLVGDIHQIESIYFGNWFSIAQKFVPRTSVFELTHPFRTTNENLLILWDRVRNADDAILEILVKSGYTTRLDASIFEHTQGDEIILCLNYDGLYGINNINRMLQTNNPNPPIVWGVSIYKIGDPILFNEVNRFSPLIHNNSKGRIVDIRIKEEQIWFNIELDVSINALDALDYDFDLIGMSSTGNSIISFSVNKYRSTDEDDDDNNSTVVPFQVAYAVSIHKAQGLEYDSVKIVITNETEERITHNIFYTAITRAKEKLKIYWSPETEKAVLERLQIMPTNKDAYLLAQLSSLKMEK